MNINELTELMVEHSLVIRAIPKEVRSIYDVRHAARYPEGTIERLPGWNRDMLVVRSKPKNAGKIIILQCKNSGAKVDFTKPEQYFDSVEDAVNSIIKSKVEEIK